MSAWLIESPATANHFDRKANIGLHHFALKVEGSAALDAVHDRLKSAPGVVVEFAPEPLGSGPTKHMMCTIPGGIRMEIIAPGG